MSIEFLSFSYKISSEPSKNRVYIWRALKNLGAIYLQQGVALLPNRKDTLDKLSKLDDLVKNSFGGKSQLAKIEFINEVDELDIVTEFKTQLSNEYDEFIKNCKYLIYEIENEIEEKNLEFSELEEIEGSLKKLKLWIKKINKRNYFDLSNYKEAEDLLEDAESKAAKFASLIYKKENI